MTSATRGRRVGVRGRGGRCTWESALHQRLGLFPSCSRFNTPVKEAPCPSEPRDTRSPRKLPGNQFWSLTRPATSRPALPSLPSLFVLRPHRERNSAPWWPIPRVWRAGAHTCFGVLLQRESEGVAGPVWGPKEGQVSHLRAPGGKGWSPVGLEAVVSTSSSSSLGGIQWAL